MEAVETKEQVITRLKPSGCAIVMIDCPTKENYLGSTVFPDLDKALSKLETDTSIKACVFISGKPETFIIGADIFEIKKAQDEKALYHLARRGQETLDRMAALRIPLVAAINGPCLGGGLELALACHGRVATDTPTTMLGLPETRLGLIPGMGGTQRLSRLVGLKAALATIMSAEPVTAQEALNQGLVDSLVSPDDLMASAEAYALSLAGDSELFAKRKQVATGACGLPDLDAEKAAKLFAMTERSVRIRTRGNYPAQTKVVEVIRHGLDAGMQSGLEMEARVFSQLAAGPIAQNLISLFFATDYARQSATALANKFNQTTPETIAIVGSGTMGAAIADLAGSCDIVVKLRVNRDRQAAARDRLQAHKSRHKGAGEEIADNVELVSADKDLSDVGFLLESIIEDKDAKTNVLGRLAAVLPADCVIASNTSSLGLAALADSVPGNERFCGLHFFYPVDRMPLVEVVSHPKTSRSALARACALVVGMGKTPVMVKDSPGFLINRVFTTYLLEAATMAGEKIPLNWIEEVATEFGMPMGPFELIDEVGLDTAFSVVEQLHRAFGARMQPHEALVKTKQLGITGKRSGNGIYLYDASGKRLEFNPKVALASGACTSPDKCPAEKKPEISDRLFLTMVDEAARCLEERIVARPRELDMAMVLGIGFPPFRGGLLRYADSLGLPVVIERLEGIYKGRPDREVSPLLRKYKEQGRSFYSLEGGSRDGDG